MISFRKINLAAVGRMDWRQNDSKDAIAVIQKRNSGLDQSIDRLDGRECIWEIQETDS